MAFFHHLLRAGTLILAQRNCPPVIKPRRSTGRDSRRCCSVPRKLKSGEDTEATSIFVPSELYYYKEMDKSIPMPLHPGKETERNGLTRTRTIQASPQSNARQGI